MVKGADPPVRPHCLLSTLDSRLPAVPIRQYFTPHPYGWLEAVVTGLPAMASSSAVAT